MISKGRVLIIKLGAMGDVIATSPIIHSLEESNYDVWLITFSDYIHSVNLDRSQVLMIDRSNKLRFVMTTILVMLKVRWRMFDVGFCFHRRAKLFSFFLWILGIQKRYGFTDSADELYTKSKVYDVIKNRTLQEFEILDLAELKYDKLPRLRHPSREPRIHSVLKHYSYITISLGGGNTDSGIGNRRWPAASYQALINLVPHNISVVLLGYGKGDADYASSINDDGRIMNLIGQLHIAETAFVIENSLCFIGNDSGLSYVAATTPVPTFVLYGPTDPILAAPLGDNIHPVVGNSKCMFCYDPREGHMGKMYTCLDNVCLQTLSPKRVFEQLKSRVNFN